MVCCAHQIGTVSSSIKYYNCQHKAASKICSTQVLIHSYQRCTICTSLVQWKVAEPTYFSNTNFIKAFMVLYLQQYETFFLLFTFIYDTCLTQQDKNRFASFYLLTIFGTTVNITVF